MVRLYSNENFPYPVVEILRSLGHDVLTTFESGLADKRTSDDEIVAFAVRERRAVLTHNRWCFVKCHERNPVHCGILACSIDADFPALANRIDEALKAHAELDGLLLRIDRPAK